MVILLSICTFAFAFWLGLYLLARDISKALLRRTGLGLVAYALALAADLLGRTAADERGAAALADVHAALVVLPALFWTGALIGVLPEDLPGRTTLDRIWTRGLLPLTTGLAVLIAVTGWLGGGSEAFRGTNAPYLGLVALVLVPLAAGLVLAVRSRRTLRPRPSFPLLLVATLFFGLGIGLLILPLPWLPRDVMLLGIAPDLVLLGAAIALMDAFDEGETLLPDITRSFAAASFLALLFGLQIAMVMLAGAGASGAMLALLLATIATAIAVQILADPLATLLDRVVFTRAPRLRRARADLRAVSSALPRVDEHPALPTVDDVEFVRLTRRALSHYGDLPRLAASPLTRLPAIDARLAARGAPDNPLERASELKALLAESIGRLKPRDGGDFGTTDAWRYYNALY
ncbi:MAG: FIG00821548: hypothetical protein, partial [uncultured Chloroflexia bacterium]